MVAAELAAEVAMVRVRRGMALIATLGIMAVLMVLATSFALAVRSELRLAATAVNRTQASWMAEAGLQQAILELRDNPAGYTALTEEAQDGQPLVMYLSSEDDERAGLTEGGFVVSAFDEAAMINLNTADADLLNRLLAADPALVDAILDWRDDDDTVRDAGAENEYYNSLEDPYQARDNWFQTVAELLLLRDVDPARFFGSQGLSPLADPQTAGVADPQQTPLSSLFTVYSYDQNLDSLGQERIDVQTADRDELLQEFDGILNEQDVDAIITYRDGPAEQQQGQQPADQAGATAITPGQVGQAAGLDEQATAALDELAGQTGADAATGPGAGADGQTEEAKKPATVAELLSVLDREKLQQIYDRLTAGEDQDLLGLVNINTASAEVLASLPGLDEYLADAIVAARREAPFETVGDLLRLTEIDDQAFQDLASHITTRTLAYRLQATGTVGEGENAWSATIWAVVQAELQPQQPAAEGETATTDTEATGPVRQMRLVYRRME